MQPDEREGPARGTGRGPVRPLTAPLLTGRVNGYTTMSSERSLLCRTDSELRCAYRTSERLTSLL